jgi:hypothetical protein
MRLDCPEICRPWSRVLEKLTVTQVVKNLSFFIKFQVLLLRFQEPASGPHPQTQIYNNNFIIIIYYIGNIVSSAKLGLPL